MKLRILIAEPRDILRAGLRSLLIEDERVGHIQEVTSREELHRQLLSEELDLVIVNQSLIADPMKLPRGRFIILAITVDWTLFQAAYQHGALGYFSEDVSAEFLRMVFTLAEGSFLIAPSIAVQAMEFFSRDTRFSFDEDVLTPREQEIVALLRKGVDRRTIARDLCISETTLKTHIKNIYRKREREKELRQTVSGENPHYYPTIHVS